MPDPRDIEMENEAAGVRTDGALLRPCKKCGCPLMFVTGPSGKVIPLDIRTKVYVVSKDMLGNATAQPAPDHHVSHFATCPAASSFSKSKKLG